MWELIYSFLAEKHHIISESIMDFPCPFWLVYVHVPRRVIEDSNSRSGSSMNVGLEVSLEPCEDRGKFYLVQEKRCNSGLLYKVHCCTTGLCAFTYLLGAKL